MKTSWIMLIIYAILYFILIFFYDINFYEFITVLGIVLMGIMFMCLSIHERIEEKFKSGEWIKNEKETKRKEKTK